MVIGVFPLAKIAVFGIKQITKPLTKNLISLAKNNSMFSKFICAPTGQLVNCFEARFKMYTLKLPQPKRIPRLSKEMANDLGARVLSEVFTLAIGVYMIYFEVSRQTEKENKKHDVHVKECELIMTQISELRKLIDLQESEIDIMYQHTESFCKNSYRL